MNARKNLTQFSIGIALMLPLLATALPAAHADGSKTQTECNKVFTEAQKLPEPTPKSIYDYGTRVVNQGEKCLQTAITPDPEPSSSPDPSDDSDGGE